MLSTWVCIFTILVKSIFIGDTSKSCASMYAMTILVHTNTTRTHHTYTSIYSFFDDDKNMIPSWRLKMQMQYTNVPVINFLSWLSTKLPNRGYFFTNFKYLNFYKLESLFPNLVIALKILLTIPVTVASGERSFSKLKIIKKHFKFNIFCDKED